MTGQAASARLRIETSLHDGPVALAEFDWGDLPDCGAEAAFLGRTRAEVHPQLGPLRRLDYEVYEPMALRLMEQLARQAAQQWHCAAVRLIHARGSVPVGRASVVIQSAAPHRAQALDACRWLIDRVKHDLPIWKHEIWDRGRTFAPGHPGSPFGSGSPGSSEDSVGCPPASNPATES